MYMTKSPSGALSPYYYKGGYFHGVHYGSYFDNTAAFLDMVSAEEVFILRSPEQRRIMMDLYETDILSVLPQFIAHIERLHTNGKIFKLAISCDKKTLKILRKALYKHCSLPKGRIYFSPDQEEGKTWLVSD